jgi:hypothetical protein
LCTAEVSNEKGKQERIKRNNKKSSEYNEEWDNIYKQVARASG